MKTRNIFTFLTAGVFAVAVATTVSCQTTETPPDPKPSVPRDSIVMTHDTIRTTDTISKFDITKITADAHAGRMEVKFTPTSDWTFTSTTPWLKVVSEMGTKADGLMVFDVLENATIDIRVANTVLTVDGVKYPLTISQKASLPMIQVFGAVTSFNEERTEVEITNIVSNVELEVASKPEWMSAAEIRRDDESGLWTVYASMTVGDADTESRPGELVIKGVGVEVSATIQVSCDPSLREYVINTYDRFGAANPFPGIATDAAEYTRFFSIFENPSNEEKYVPVAFNMTFTGAIPSNPTKAAWITLQKSEPKVQALGAYPGTDWDVITKEYINNSRRDQYAGVFLVKESAAAKFKPVNGVDVPIFSVQQTGAAVIEILQKATYDINYVFETASIDLGADKIKISIRGDKTPKFVINKVGGIDFPGEVKLISRNPTTNTDPMYAGWVDCVYDIVMTRAQADLYPFATKQISHSVNIGVEENPEIPLVTGIVYKFTNYKQFLPSPDASFDADKMDGVAPGATASFKIWMRKGGDCAGMVFKVRTATVSYYSYANKVVTDATVISTGADAKDLGNGYVQLAYTLTLPSGLTRDEVEGNVETKNEDGETVIVKGGYWYQVEGTLPLTYTPQVLGRFAYRY